MLKGSLFLLLFSLCLLTGCSRPVTSQALPPLAPPVSDALPVPGDWVVRNLEADPDTLNPLLMTDFYAYEIAGHVFETLLQLNRTTLQLEPQLAQSWEISPDKLTFTFHLRHDVRWQDGQSFTADDVLYSYQRLMDPKVDAAFLRADYDSIATCQELDPWTVRFTARKIYFRNLSVLGGLPLVPKHLLEHAADFNSDPFARHPVGTGPYRLVRWDAGSLIILERNESYWGPKIYYPHRLVYRVLKEAYVSLQLLKKGELDLIDPVEPTQWVRQLEGHAAAARLQKIVYSLPAYGYIGFNLRRPVFSDVRVRHALDLLIPRDEILAKIYFNQYAVKTSGFALPNSGAYNPAVLPTPYDPALARQLLTQAGWTPDPRDGLLHKNGQTLTFTFLYPGGSERAQKILELVQESFRQNGVDIRLSQIEWAQYLNQLNEWKYDACMLSWVLVPDTDPYNTWDSKQALIQKSSNFIGYQNPAADRLIETAQAEYDPAKRDVLYRQLHQIIHDDYPVCFLFNPRVIMVVSDRFRAVKTFAPQPCYDPSQWYVPARLQKYQP